MKGKAKQNFFTRRWKLPLREVKHVQLQHLETICYQQSSKVCSINFFSLFMSPFTPPPLSTELSFLLVLLIEHNTVDIRCFNFIYIFARIYSSANRVAISQISSFSRLLLCVEISSPISISRFFRSNKMNFETHASMTREFLISIETHQFFISILMWN